MTRDVHAARWLVEEVAGRDAAALRRERDEIAPPEAVARLHALLERVEAGEPLQHVLGHWRFRTLDLLVDGRALIPRPETEVVVEHALAALRKLAGGARLLAADLGTGGGAIACSLVAELEAVEVHAVDASPDALALAAANASRLPPAAARRLHLHEGDWYGPLAALQGRLDLLVANPPYLAASELAGLDPVVRDFDPPAALVSGPTGLEAHEAVIGGAPRALAAGGFLVAEIAPGQSGDVIALARGAGAGEVRVERDLAGRERVLVARW